MPAQTYFQSVASTCHRSLQQHAIAGLRWFLSCAVLGVSLLAVHPSEGAERIYVTYNVLERSISVNSLEIYAKTGYISDDLAVYAQYASPKALQDLRNALSTKADVKPITVAQFLYSPQGEAALKRLGQVIQPDSRIDSSSTGFKAIRAALILASRDPEGLTLLTFLRKFPATGIRIDVERSLSMIGEAQQLINQTQQATQKIIQLSELEASQQSQATLKGQDLSKLGSYVIDKRTITLNDPSRSITTVTPDSPVGSSGANLLKGRVYEVDIYLPAIATSRSPASIPVVVISHGLGSDRSSFVYLARHLASHGFAVLVPEHPGSGSKQMEALLQGVASEVAEPTEFANRPLDISYLLDYLENQTTANPEFRVLNLKQVGVVGHSFGGYTALALAGAPINFQQLQADCSDKAQENTFNISLLLQCRARQLEQTGQPRSDFRDTRIQAAIALNPINSTVIGKNNLARIQTPTMIVAGSADTVAPALFEQIQPFSALTTPEKYLLQMDPGTHFSVMDGVESGGGAFAFPPEVIGPDPQLARRYVNAFVLAFFQTYVANQTGYRPYLTATYAKSIAKPEIRLDLIRSLNLNQLSRNE
jgi:predicted dienelactone hydrolase